MVNLHDPMAAAPRQPAADDLIRSMRAAIDQVQELLRKWENSADVLTLEVNSVYARAVADARKAIADAEAKHRAASAVVAALSSSLTDTNAAVQAVAGVRNAITEATDAIQVAVLAAGITAEDLRRMNGAKCLAANLTDVD
jgi:hypothetical protein